MYQSADLFTYRPVMMSYRKDVLESRGLAVPDTWEQLLQVCMTWGWHDLLRLSLARVLGNG